MGDREVYDEDDGERIYQCGGCNNTCSEYYTLDDFEKQPESWLCATCMIDIIVGKEIKEND